TSTTNFSTHIPHKRYRWRLKPARSSSFRAPRMHPERVRDGRSTRDGKPNLAWLAVDADSPKNLARVVGGSVLTERRDRIEATRAHRRHPRGQRARGDNDQPARRVGHRIEHSD